MSSKVITRRQACWAEFHFSITYHPGPVATLADALSRWDNVYPERGEDFISKNPINFQQLTKQDELQLSNWVVVSNDPTIQLSILQKRHDSPLAGHPGQEKTVKPVKPDFHCPKMTQFIKDYVSSCQQCSRNKNINHKKFGFLKPLPIPYVPWICLSKDFITQLPLSNSFDSILVIVDRIVSDRGSLFVSSFWTNLCQQLKIQRDLSTSYHPETDGQTERVNQILEQYLWMYVSYHQDDWNTWLPLAEFAYNNCDHSSKKQSPLFTVDGRDPQFAPVQITQDTPAGKVSTKIHSVQ
ncbi:hypothetical protein O181_038247 [Austropuccinia psidii MF-1]|uniref:Integrase catalytic domain-containing protein n=1 Tax=Austropuccinia psidii MF-1 TaxID=1389203 RepID=A0A9Q3DAK1_9BASI|nr:hypothetical protein [Austropuccinia psidii MF-1]